MITSIIILCIRWSRYFQNRQKKINHKHHASGLQVYSINSRISKNFYDYAVVITDQLVMGVNNLFNTWWQTNLMCKILVPTKSEAPQTKLVHSHRMKSHLLSCFVCCHKCRTSLFNISRIFWHALNFLCKNAYPIYKESSTTLGERKLLDEPNTQS